MLSPIKTKIMSRYLRRPTNHFSSNAADNLNTKSHESVPFLYIFFRHKNICRHVYIKKFKFKGGNYVQIHYKGLKLLHISNYHIHGIMINKYR